MIRALVSKGPDLSQAEVFEAALPHEIIDEATLKDEMALFEIFKENASNGVGKISMSDFSFQIQLCY